MLFARIYVALVSLRPLQQLQSLHLVLLMPLSRLQMLHL
jgi:hypothetical protein